MCYFSRIVVVCTQPATWEYHPFATENNQDVIKVGKEDNRMKECDEHNALKSEDNYQKEKNGILSKQSCMAHT